MEYSQVIETAWIFAFTKNETKLKKALQNITNWEPNFSNQEKGFTFQCKTTMINVFVKALNANSIRFHLFSSQYSTVYVEARDRRLLFNSKLFAYIGNHIEFFGYQCFFRKLNDFINFNQKYLNKELKSIGVIAIFPYRIMYQKTNNHKPQDWPHEKLKKSDIYQCNEQLNAILQEQQHKVIQEEEEQQHKIIREVEDQPESFESRLEEALNEHHICGELREYFQEAANDIKDKNDPELNIIKAICDLLDEDAYEVLKEVFQEDQDYEKVSNEFLEAYFN